MRGLPRVWAAGMVLLSSLAIGTQAENTATAASVLIVQGVPGSEGNPEFAIDVLLDDSLCALSGVAYGDILGPMPFEPRWHNWKISAANLDAPCGTPPIVEAWVLLKEGEQVSLVAHRDDYGELRIAKFANNLRAMEPGTTRTVVHHVAGIGKAGFALQYQPNEEVDPVEEQDFNRTVDTPTWDDFVHTDGDDVILPDLICGKKGKSQLRAGRWDLWTFHDGELAPFSGPMQIRARAYTVKLVFAVGSPEAGTFRVLQKELDVKPRGQHDFENEDPPEPGRREQEVVTISRTGSS